MNQAMDKELIEYLQSVFKRLSRYSAKKLADKIYNCVIHINLETIMKNTETFISQNLTRLTKIEKEDTYSKTTKVSYEISLETLKELRPNIEKIYEKYNKQDEKEDISLSNCLMYGTYRNVLSEEDGEFNKKYDFDKPDIEIDTPKNTDTLQRCKIQILDKGVGFDYPIKYVYNCPECGNEIEKAAHITASTNNRILCDGTISYVDSQGNGKVKQCKRNLAPDMEVSLIKEAFFYQINYKDSDGNKKSATAISFINLNPGFYEVVLFRVNNPKKQEMYHIIDTKEQEKNVFNVPVKIEGENYMYTLVDAFDNYIKSKTGLSIHGLYPIKYSIILQKLAKVLDLDLNYNILVQGDAETGKTTILKYYGYLLYNSNYLFTDGMSISVPALRGSVDVVSLMGQTSKIVTAGHLGSYDLINIDEAGENRELIHNLKSFILNANYSYDKHGGDKSKRKRTAHIAISENPDSTHLGRYIGMIKKKYNTMSGSIKTSDVDTSYEEEVPVEEPWDDTWDLHQPLEYYDFNEDLKQCVIEARNHSTKQGINWSNGYEIAVNQRFPFSFYIVKNGMSSEMRKKILMNFINKPVSEEYDLLNKLVCDEIDEFFKSLVKFEKSDEDIEFFNKHSSKLTKGDSAREDQFYLGVCMLVRILNQRFNYEESDLDIVKYISNSIFYKRDISQLEKKEKECTPSA